MYQSTYNIRTKARGPLLPRRRCPDARDKRRDESRVGAGRISSRGPQVKTSLGQWRRAKPNVPT
jgi:hypothetical protein